MWCITRGGYSFCALMLAAGSFLLASHAEAMTRYLWEKRPLIIFAPTGDTAVLQRQRALLGAALPQMRKRDMVVIYVIGNDVRAILGDVPDLTSQQLRQRYDVPYTAFRTLLVGKDGGVKLRSWQVVTTRRLFSLIDAMPMRMEEMETRRRGR
jgi:hypothetical protein